MIQQFYLLLLLLLFPLVSSVGTPRQHNLDFGARQRYCLQELNKVVSSQNGTFVSGEGFMSKCKHAHVFKGKRSGIILSAECPDVDGQMHTASKFFEIPPKTCNNYR